VGNVTGVQTCALPISDGKLQQPAGDLEQAFTASSLVRNKSCPRLTVDEAGGVSLFMRHHPLPGALGEVWNSFAFRYNGKQWSPRSEERRVGKGGERWM